MTRKETSRVPTLNQGARLLVLSNGNIALAPRRGDWGPLLRRGWVETISEDDKDKRYLPPLRITPDGLRAVAAAMEKYPEELRPEIKPRDFYKQLDKSPHVEKLEAANRKVREERDEAQREATRLRHRMARVESALEGWNGRA